MKRIIGLAMALILLAAVPVVPVSADETPPPEVANGTLVWDMEDLPENFDDVVSDLFTELWGSQDVAYGAGNITLASAPGKGYGGSAALAWTVAKNGWGGMTYVDFYTMENTVTDWTGATEFYFHVDASEINVQVPIQVLLAHDNSNYSNAKGATYYYWQDGQWEAGTVNEWGHMFVPAGYVGWVRVPFTALAAQPADLAEVSRIAFQTEHNVVGGTVYFDHFVINAKESEGVTIQDLLAYPEGKKWTLTLSYDDGSPNDVQMVELLNRYGIKCTFNLIGDNISRGNWAVTPAQVGTLYAGHEVANHTWTHPNMKDLTAQEQREELQKNNAYLSDLCGYPVRGLAYPFGTGCYNEDTFVEMAALGIVYGRTTTSTRSFKVPENFLLWDATITNTQGAEALEDTFDRFISRDRGIYSNLYYLWGHSFEFAPENGGFGILEDFCEMAAAHGDKIWFATNIEIYDYITATRQATLSQDGTTVQNGSDQVIWIRDGEESISIPAGESYVLGSNHQEPPVELDPEQPDAPAETEPAGNDGTAPEEPISLTPIIIAVVAAVVILGTALILRKRKGKK